MSRGVNLRARKYKVCTWNETGSLVYVEHRWPAKLNGMTSRAEPRRSDSLQLVVQLQQHTLRYSLTFCKRLLITPLVFSVLSHSNFIKSCSSTGNLQKRVSLSRIRVHCKSNRFLSHGIDTAQSVRLKIWIRLQLSLIIQYLFRIQYFHSLTFELCIHQALVYISQCSRHIVVVDVTPAACRHPTSHVSRCFRISFTPYWIQQAFLWQGYLILILLPT